MDLRSLARRKGSLVAWGIATVLVVLALGRVDWGGVGRAVATANPAWIGAAVAANASILLLWAVQWRIFVSPVRSVPLGRMLDVTATMAMACNTIPFFGGHAAGVHLLATRGGTGHAAALSVVALDQLAEGAAKLVAILLLAAVTPLPPGVRAGLVGLAAAVALLAGVLLLFSGAEQWLRSVVSETRHPFSRLAWARRTLAFLADASRHLRAVRRPRTVLLGLVLALGMKVVEAGGILAVQHALGVELPLWSVLLVLVAVGLATMVSLAPANLGVYEAATFVAYRWAGIPTDTALGLALVQHACFLLPMLLSGWAAVARWRRMRRGGDATAGFPVCPDVAGD